MFTLGPGNQISAVIDRPLRERIFSAATAAMAYWFYRWDWGESVVFDAFAVVSSTTGMKLFSDFVDTTVEQWVSQPRPAPPSRKGPALSVLNLFERSGRQNYLTFACEMGDHLVSLEKLANGPVILDPERKMAFVDSHYGDPSFLLELSRLTGDTKYAVRGMEILLNHSRAL